MSNYIRIECCTEIMDTWIAMPVQVARKLPGVYRDEWGYYSYWPFQVLIQVDGAFWLRRR